MPTVSLNKALRAANIAESYARKEIDALTALAHHNIVQTSLMHVAISKFSQINDLNAIDFRVMCQAVNLVATSDRAATPGHLSEDLALSASTLTSILERLLSRGLIVRDRDPSDRRRIAVVPTEAAWQLIEDYYTLVRRAYAAVFADVDEADLDAMTKTMAQLQSANSALLAQLDSVLEKSQGEAAD